MTNLPDKYNNKIPATVGVFFLLVALLPASPAEGFRLLEAEYLGIEGWKTGFLRDPYFPAYTSEEDYLTEQNEYTGEITEVGKDESWLGGAAFRADLTLVERSKYRWYWNNRIAMDGTRHQVRHVKWWWDIGVSLGPKVDLFYEHESRHCLECNPGQPYPIRDVYGFRFNLYKRGE